MLCLKMFMIWYRNSHKMYLYFSIKVFPLCGVDSLYPNCVAKRIHCQWNCYCIGNYHIILGILSSLTVITLAVLVAWSRMEHYITCFHCPKFIFWRNKENLMDLSEFLSLLNCTAKIISVSLGLHHSLPSCSKRKNIVLIDINVIKSFIFKEH